MNAVSTIYASAQLSDRRSASCHLHLVRDRSTRGSNSFATFTWVLSDSTSFHTCTSLATPTLF